MDYNTTISLQHYKRSFGSFGLQHYNFFWITTLQFPSTMMNVLVLPCQHIFQKFRVEWHLLQSFTKGHGYFQFPENIQKPCQMTNFFFLGRHHRIWYFHTFLHNLSTSTLLYNLIFFHFHFSHFLFLFLFLGPPSLYSGPLFSSLFPDSLCPSHHFS